MLYILCFLVLCHVISNKHLTEGTGSLGGGTYSSERENWEKENGPPWRKPRPVADVCGGGRGEQGATWPGGSPGTRSWG
jgi:hypothetical protein